MRPTWNTHTNDISVRFKTREQDGLLFTTSNNRNQDFLRALLDRGRVRVIHNIGGDERVSPTRRLKGCTHKAIAIAKATTIRNAFLRFLYSRAKAKTNATSLPDGFIENPIYCSH